MQTQYWIWLWSNDPVNGDGAERPLSAIALWAAPPEHRLVVRKNKGYTNIFSISPRQFSLCPRTDRIIKVLADARARKCSDN